MLAGERKMVFLPSDGATEDQDVPKDIIVFWKVTHSADFHVFSTVRKIIRTKVERSHNDPTGGLWSHFCYVRAVFRILEKKLHI